LSIYLNGTVDLSYEPVCSIEADSSREQPERNYH